MDTLLFYDTNVLLSKSQNIFELGNFYISSISLKELENIKTSATKDEETKYNARVVLRALQDENKYKTVLYTKQLEAIIDQFDLPINEDSKIIACAYDLQEQTGQPVLFVSNDLACRKIAEAMGIKSFPFKEDFDDEYTGFKTIELAEEDLADFYTSYADNNNDYGLLENEYIIIKSEGKIVDKYKWKDGKYQSIPFYKVDSKMFGEIKPKNGDIYQHLALDSLATNQITMLRGAAGSGKSYLAFGYMFSLLEHGKIDKIVIFCNTVATKGSAKLGFYPGSRTEKLLDSQIGNLLESKLGDRIAVERLIDDGQLILLPMSDIRGYDTTGMKAAIYISEAQNLDIELMRLALQRIGEDSICIIDGDDKTQVDMSMYAGNNNGMKRASQVFRGKPYYGEVELQKIYRSAIAETAQLM